MDGPGVVTKVAASGVTGSTRRQEIVAVATELFAERGYRATTMRDIADASGVLPGSLYHHFESKESLIGELLTSYYEDLLKTMRPVVHQETGAVEALRRLVVEAFRSLSLHRAAVMVLQNEMDHLVRMPGFENLKPMQREVRRLWVEVLDKGRRDGTFRTDVEPDVTYRFIRDAVWVSVRWYQPSGRLSPDDLAGRYLTLILSGIKADQVTSTT